jgi:NAD+ diphosphatase
VLLGQDEEGRTVFAALSADDADNEADPAIKLIDLRSLAVQAALSPADLGLLAQARTLLHWHSRHRFCANCGAPTRAADAGYRRTCDACRAEHFPRTDPVAIIVVVDRDRALLGRQPTFAPQVYSALAGFLEPGESIEEAARREVFEEAGVRVGRVAYHSSQPWPFPANLMIGLIGEAVTAEIAIDPSELEEARWFPREELRAMLEGRHPEGLKVPAPMAIAWHLIRTAAYPS